MSNRAKEHALSQNLFTLWYHPSFIEKITNLLYISTMEKASKFVVYRILWQIKFFIAPLDTPTTYMGPKNGFWKNFWSIFLRIGLTPSSCDYCLLIFFSVIHKTLASYRKTSCFFTIKWIMWRICGHLICNGWLNTLSWLQI